MSVMSVTKTELDVVVTYLVEIDLIKASEATAFGRGLAAANKKAFVEYYRGRWPYEGPRSYRWTHATGDVAQTISHIIYNS